MVTVAIKKKWFIWEIFQNCQYEILWQFGYRKLGERRMTDNSQGSNLKRLDVPNDSRKYAVGTNPQEEGENGERR